jgi:hypothetical protein
LQEATQSKEFITKSSPRAHVGIIAAGIRSPLPITISARGRFNDSAMLLQRGATEGWADGMADMAATAYDPDPGTQSRQRGAKWPYW